MNIIIGAILMTLGLFVEGIAVLGIFKFHFGLNRMHSAAIGDTLGMGLVCVGLAFMCGFSVTTLKLLIVILCFWLAGPVSSHLLARLEITTNEKIDEYAKEITLPQKTYEGERVFEAKDLVKCEKRNEE